jgi:predicted kinase
MNIIILRGIPGSGKSTYVRDHFRGAIVCSADKFFTKDGEYKFDPSFLKDAHTYCYNQFAQACEFGEQGIFIVVDNTNSRIWEFQNYLNLAKDLNIPVSVIRFTSSVVDATNRNIHGVPIEAIQRMSDRFEDYKGEILF